MMFKPPTKKTKCQVKSKTVEAEKEACGLRRSPRETASWKVDYCDEDSASDDDNVEEVTKPLRYSDDVKHPAKNTKSQIKGKTQDRRRNSRAAAAGEMNYEEESPSDEELIEQYRPTKNSRAAPKKAGKKKDKVVLFTALTGTNASDESTLPGPGWTLGSCNRASRSCTLWISPQRKIMFEKKHSAHQFEAIRREYNGDEYKAWDDYRGRVQKQQGRVWTGVINPRQFDAPGASKYFAKRDPSALDAGWERVARLETSGYRSGYRNHWLSPQFKIGFKFGKRAVQFEAIRQECGGDEEKAWHVFVTKFSSKQVQNSVDGGLHGLEKAKGVKF